MKDDELVRLISNPDTATKGFEILVIQYREQLYWKIRHLVLDHDDASDVLQNTFIKVWKNIRNFEGKSALSTWLYRIAINESLDFIRRQKNKISTDEVDGLVANRLLADEYFDGDETQAMLQEAIASLPEVQRTVFTLKYYNDMKYSEISEILGTTEGALKASYHLAVKKITEYFKTHD